MKSDIRRIRNLETLTDEQHGICVACLRTECSYPERQGTRQCGKRRDDLPHVLWMRPPAGGSTPCSPEEAERDVDRLIQALQRRKDAGKRAGSG